MKIGTLTRRAQFIRLQKRAKRYFASKIYIDITKHFSSGIYYGITASTKFGTACERNRFKRIARQAVSNLQGKIPSQTAFIIYPKKAVKDSKTMEVEQQLLSLLQEHDTNS